MAHLKDWKAISASKKQERQNKVPKEWLIDVSHYNASANVLHVPGSCGLLSETEKLITSNFDATALLEKLRDGTFSAEEVTTNCLTEVFFPSAIARARSLDASRQANPDAPLAPLHGLPISLKDSFKIPGLDSSVGIAGLCHVPDGAYSALPQLLLDLGAVLYCKTNVPQTLMTADSDNNVFGRALNPHNTALTAGGSSGGEGALVALRGSVLGVGTDIAGSIRIPAACCGTYGFKASVGVVPYAGQRSVSRPGYGVVKACAGPLATSLRDCALFVREVMRAAPWWYDATALGLPWTGVQPKGVAGLRVGVARDDGRVMPHPPVRRALEEAVGKLRKAGVECVELRLPDGKGCYDDLMKYFAVGGYEYILDMLKSTGEPLVPSVKHIALVDVPPPDLDELAALNVRRVSAMEQYRKLFVDNSLDAILMPAAPHAALPHDTWKEASYTGLWNYLDYPACVIPVGTVLESDAPDDVGKAQLGRSDLENHQKYTDAEVFADAPIGLQIVGYSRMDEALLNSAAHIDSIVNDHRL